MVLQPCFQVFEADLVGPGLKNPALLAVPIGSIAALFRYNCLKRSGLVLNSKTPGCLAARVTSVLG